MTKQRAGRRRRQHAGVKVLTLADGRRVARWNDPLTKRQQQQSLDKLGLTSDAARREWARQKADQIAEIRRALSLGHAQTVRLTVRKAIEKYLDGIGHDRTRAGKDYPLRMLADRLEQAGVAELSALTGPVLVTSWRDWVTSPTRAHAPGTKNHWLAIAGTFLRWARRRGMAPLLTLEAIKDAGFRVAEPIEPIEFLTPAEIRRMLEAAIAHDSADVRRRPVAPFVLGLLLSGCRLRELAQLQAGEVQVDGIHLPAARVKTRRARVVTFAESPALAQLLAALKPKDADPESLVFGKVLHSWPFAVERMIARHGAPQFTAQSLRRTCGTITTNAPAIAGAASAWHSAKRLGHSVEIAERDYAGRLTGLPPDARTIEAAVGIEDLCKRIVGAV